MVCKYCGSTALYVKETGTHTGLYCASSICNKWQIWVGAKTKGNYKHLPHYGLHDVPRLVEAVSSNSYSYQLDPLPQEFGGQDTYTNTSQDNYMQPQEQHYMQPEPLEEHYESYSYQPQTRQQEPQKQMFTEMCVACISGVVPSVDNNEMFTLQYKKTDGLLIMVSKRTSEAVFTASVKCCPMCGK